MNPSPYRSISQVQAIYGALILGVVGAAAAMAAIRVGTPGSAPAAAQGEMFLIIVGVMTASCVALAIGARSFFVARARRGAAADRSSPDAFLHPYSTAMLVRGALLESPGLMGCVVFMVTGEWAALGAAGVSLLFMAVLFPTRAGLERFAADASRPADIFPPVHREHDGRAIR